MAIFDCFQFFNEDHIVDLRFHILDKFVDHFVIVESTLNHQGKTKKLNFDINNYQKFKRKIIYIVVDDTPKKLLNLTLEVNLLLSNIKEILLKKV